MSDNAFLRLDGLKAALSRVKTKVDSDIASAISESTISLTSLISSGDSSTLTNAKSYIDGIKTNLDSTIASNLATAKGYTDGAKTALETNITNHKNDTSNPHSVTKTQIGLSNVDNTSDLDKPISTAVQTALDDLEDRIDAIDESGSSVTLASLGGASATDLTNHINDTTNPHSVTYTQVGAAASSHTHTESDITDLGNYANSSHTHTEADITDLGNYSVTGHSHTVSDITDASTELASKSHTHTEADITDLGSYASSSHTHTVSDITDSSSLASSNDISTLTTAINSYGVSSISINSSTGVLTLTMKDNSTKTVTIPLSSGGGNSGASITAVNYDDSDEELIFTLDNNSTVTCDISDLISQLNITYESLDPRTYNSDWEDQMTGTGTELDPYLIYTPKDFTKINEDMSAHYKLMNNLDFSAAIGMTIDTSGNSYQSTTIDSSAPLYHNGEGYWPIGYNGYYPLNDASGVMNSTQHFSDISGTISYIGNSSATRDYGTIQKYGFFGELDGNYKTIKGIACAPADTYSVGIFHFLGTSAYIHNLTVKDSVFILSGNLNPSGFYSGIGTLAGFVLADNSSKTFTINNVYTYATLINAETKTGNTQYSYTNGLVGRSTYQSYTKYSINQCANHATFIQINPDVTHVISGIYNHDSGNGSGNITNCINTSSFGGNSSTGMGYSCGKVNINCGTLTGSNAIRPIVTRTQTTAVNGKQFANRSMESTDFYSSETSANSYNIYYKTTAELKSPEFISEANALLPEPVFAYNDLNVNDGWPLLIDEYNTIVGVNGNLNVSLIDPIANKVYKSGFSLERLQKTVTANEVNYQINGQIEAFNQSQFNNLKIVSTAILTTDWSLDSNTNKYTATKTVTGVVSTSPIQLLTQFGSEEISISAVTTNSITFICDSQPASDINASVMFTL